MTGTYKTITHTMTMLVEECCRCGVAFGMPSELVDECQKDSKKYFYCPNGHSQHYSRSEADKLRTERNNLKQQLARKDDEIANQKSKTEIERRRVSAAKGQLTKLKNRAKAGVCPCCNCTFKNLQRHMQSQHPDIDERKTFKVIDGDKAA